MIRSVHGIELTAAGRAFLDHARLAAYSQAEAARGCGGGARRNRRMDFLFAIGFAYRLRGGLAAGCDAKFCTPNFPTPGKSSSIARIRRISQPVSFEGKSIWRFCARRSRRAV